MPPPASGGWNTYANVRSISPTVRASAKHASGSRCSTLYRRTSSSPMMWSAWLWVKRMASTRVTPWVSACARKSVDVSTRIDCTASLTVDRDCGPALVSSSIKIDGRLRRSRGSVERHTRHSQPIIGTPWEVPVPGSVTLRFKNPLSATRRRHKAHSQLVKHLLEHLALFCRQVTLGFLLQQLEDVNHLRRPFEVRLGLLSGGRIGQVAEMNGRGTGQREDERRKGKGHLGCWAQGAGCSECSGAGCSVMRYLGA